MHGTATAPLTVADLARRADLRLGDVIVSPASREIRGLEGSVTVEPRVMQVLLALADAGGAVITRDELVRRCWAGRFVGEDSLNQAIAEVRKAIRLVAGGSFAVETIPKTGYRLTGAIAPARAMPPDVGPPPPITTTTLSRRTLLLGGAGGVAALGGLATWRLWPDPRADRAAELSERGALALRDALPGGSAQAIGLLGEAVALAPDDASAWGRLALAWSQRVEESPPAEAARAVAAAERAAREALRRAPRQPDAHAALATLLPIYGDWLAAERRLRAVLALDPANEAATAALGLLLMSTGRLRAATATSAALVARFPLSPVYNYRRAYHLWSLGRLGEMDRLADRAMQLWPRHPGVWMARLWTLAYTGRAPLALAQLDDREGRPELSPRLLDGLRTTCRALATRAPGDIAAAVAVNRATAMYGPGGAVSAVQHLAALGAVDDAFDAAYGFLLRRGPLAGPLRHPRGVPAINDQRQRKTMMLWIPATAPLRADVRFLPLCRDIGLVDYWRASGTRPDFLGTRPLPV